MGFLTSSCALFKMDDATMEISALSLASTQGHKFFVANIQPWLKDTMNCDNCHTNHGVANPAFADANIFTAYNNAKLVTNFVNPTGSLFVSKMNSAHNCGSACSAAAAYLTDAIAAWKVAEESEPIGSGVAGDLVLPPVLVPADLPTTAGQFRRMDWPLDALAGLSGYVLSLEVLFFDNQSYVVRNPRVIYPTGGTLKIQVKSLKIGTITNPSGSLLLNPQYSTYGALDTIVSTGLSFSSAQPLAQRVDGPGADYFFLSVQVLEPTNGSGAGLAFYNSNVVPAITGANCDNCHYQANIGPTPPQVPYAVFIYNDILPRLGTYVGAGTPAALNSLLISKPTLTNGQTHGGGLQCATANSSPCNVFQQWWAIEFGP